MKKIRLAWLFLAVVLSLAGTRVWADDQPAAPQSGNGDTAGTVSLADFEALKARISALESNSGLGLKVDGWLQLWYTHDSYGTTATGTSNDYSGSKDQWDAFSVKRAEIVFSGNVGVDPKITFKLSLDPAQPSFNGLGGTAGSTITYGGTSSSTTNVNIFTLVKDIYTQVAFSPYAAFLAGQDKLWNDLEGRIPSKDLDYNNYSNVGGSFGNKRDLGAALTGAGIPLGPVQGEYYLTVIQGSGQSTADNNVDKDLAGRIGFTYDNNLFVGASAYSGWEPNGVRQDIGLEGRWISGGWKFQGEFITGSLNTLDNNSANDSAWTPSLPTVKGFTTPAGQITPTGYYLQASYRLGDFRLGARWDGYNFNQQNVSASAGNQEWDTYTFGLDWFQAKDAYKLSLNWEDHLLNGVDTYNVWTVQSQIAI